MAVCNEMNIQPPSKKILILGQEQDPHIQWVTRGLALLGTEASVFDIRRYPAIMRHSIRFDTKLSMKSNEGPSFTPDDPYSAIWVRRPGAADVSALAIADGDREYVEQILALYDHELWSLLNFVASSNETLWINSPTSAARASSKLLQMRAATDAGLSVPPTLVSNDPNEIRDFARTYDSVICKSFAPKLWEKEGGGYAKTLTARIDPFDVGLENSIRIQPSIYQPEVRKAFELRVLFLDGQLFGMRINSQLEPDLSLDWRRRPLSSRFVEKAGIPKDIEAGLIRTAQALGIRMGSFDLLVDDEGKTWFLEVNEAGQFLFLEQHIPELRILDAFCHLLVHGSLDGWIVEKAHLRLSEVISI